MAKLLHEELTAAIRAAAIEVHRNLGPGLLESVYEECLCYELTQRGCAFQRQLALPIMYKDIKLTVDFRVDVFVEKMVVLELKSVAEVLPVHEAQLLTYMKLCQASVGLLMNFNVPRMTDGIVRRVL